MKKLPASICLLSLPFTLASCTPGPMATTPMPVQASAPPADQFVAETDLDDYSNRSEVPPENTAAEPAAEAPVR